jgi:hypothetical protein
MKPEQLRIALFSGNYNYVRDGANQALNRLVDYLLRQGAAVRIYSPTVENPALEAVGDVVSVPAIAAPGRPEYRLPLRLPMSVKRDMADFDPNIIHVASPDVVAHRAISWARRRDIAVVASVHTRFETYLEYYHLEWLEPSVRAAAEAFLPALRCDCRAGGVDRGDPPRPAHEPRYFDLDARDRPYPVQSRRGAGRSFARPRLRRR